MLVAQQDLLATDGTRLEYIELECIECGCTGNCGECEHGKHKTHDGQQQL